MDRKRVDELFKLFGRPAFKIGDKCITIARQDMDDVEEIENMPTHKLIDEWKGLVWLNYIYGCVSLNDLQRISLIELEFEGRGFKGVIVDGLDICRWYDDAFKQFEARQDNTSAKKRSNGDRRWT